MPTPYLPEKRWRRNAISALMLFHLIVIPLGSILSVRERFHTDVSLFMIRYAFGLKVMQYWELFSPEPRREARKYSAIITFQSEEKKRWSRPYPPKWDFFPRHLSYSFQKWDLVSNRLDRKTDLWKNLGDYLATLYHNDLNPVTKIEFIRSTAPWPPPSPIGYVGGEEKDLVWKDELLFTYDPKRQRYL